MLQTYPQSLSILYVQMAQFWLKYWTKRSCQLLERQALLQFLESQVDFD
jgi:hypothetical protein